MDLGFKLAVSNRNLKHPTSRQIFGDTSGLLCKNDQILRPSTTEKSHAQRENARQMNHLVSVYIKLQGWLHIHPRKMASDKKEILGFDAKSI